MTGQSALHDRLSGTIEHHQHLFRLALALYAGVNFVAAIYGAVFWYGDFFATAGMPLWAYPFVPDCPLANFVSGLAFLWMARRRPSHFLNSLAGVFCIKYGTWTMLAWLLYWSRTGDYNALSLFLFVTHLGLTIQGVILIAVAGRLKLRTVLAIAAWFMLSDLVDYAPVAARPGGYGWYPPLPLGTNLVPPLMLQTMVMTGLLSAILAVKSFAQQNPIYSKRTAQFASRAAMSAMTDNQSEQ